MFDRTSLHFLSDTVKKIKNLTFQEKLVDVFAGRHTDAVVTDTVVPGRFYTMFGRDPLGP